MSRASTNELNAVRTNARSLDITVSDTFYARSSGLIPGHTQLLAKGPTQWVFGVAPKYLDRGKGCRVWDVDGNEYIDLSMASGPISLGYCYDRVDDAIRKQLAKGVNFSLVHPLEVEVAELLREVVPGAEMVRFSKTGADVTSAAVRVSRAFTGRDKVLSCGYHGWHDWYIGTTARHRGVPSQVRALTVTVPYNDFDALERHITSELACVILEPMIFDEPKPGYLAEVRRSCDRHGVVLVFDEMWTGFRFALGGAQQYFGVRADLATYSKAVANGLPLSVLAGKAEIMRLFAEDLFFFTTFGGETLALAAAHATILELAEREVPGHLFRQGDKLKQGYNAIAAQLDMPYTRCVGLGPRTMIAFDPGPADPLEMKSLVQQEMLKRGVLWSGFHHMCFSHTDDDVEYVLGAYREVLPLLCRAVGGNSVRAQLLGEPVQAVFRKTKDE